MKGNLMDSIVSLASIAKRYDIWIEIRCVDKVGPELSLTKHDEKTDNIYRRSMILNPDVLSMDFEEICRRFVDEFTGTVRDQ